CLRHPAQPRRGVGEGALRRLACLHARVLALASARDSRSSGSKDGQTLSPRSAANWQTIALGHSTARGGIQSCVSTLPWHGLRIVLHVLDKSTQFGKDLAPARVIKKDTGRRDGEAGQEHLQSAVSYVPPGNRLRHARQSHAAARGPEEGR